MRNLISSRGSSFFPVAAAAAEVAALLSGKMYSW